MGRYSDSAEVNYSFDQLIKLIGSQIDRSPEFIDKHHYIDGISEEENVLFPLRSENGKKSIWIKITDWIPNKTFDVPGPNSKRRGRITANFKVAPFFEHVKNNEFGY